MRAWQGWRGISCTACGRNLAYQSGAAVVKCPGCESVLNVSGLPLTEVAGQAECAGCHQIIVFRAEHAATTVGLVCTTCASFTRVPPAYFYNCRGCGLYLTYCARLPCVICAVCRTVYPPPRPAPLFPTLSLAPLVPALHRPPRPPPALPPRRLPLLRSTPVVPVPGPRPPPLPRPVVPPHPVPPEPPPEPTSPHAGQAGPSTEPGGSEQHAASAGPSSGDGAGPRGRRLKWKPKLRRGEAEQTSTAPAEGAEGTPSESFEANEADEAEQSPGSHDGEGTEEAEDEDEAAPADNEEEN